MYFRLAGMREPLAPNCGLAKANVDLRPVVEMRELLAFEKQGRKPIVSPRPSTFFDRELAESLTQIFAECVQAYSPGRLTVELSGAHAGM